MRVNAYFRDRQRQQYRGGPQTGRGCKPAFAHRAGPYCECMDDVRLREVLLRAAGAVRVELGEVGDWSTRAKGHAAQFAVDVVADEAAVTVLERAGLGVLSEESGLHGSERHLLVVLDPLDGSSNAARRLPWYATSLCLLDADGPRIAVVVNQATGEVFDAIRGRGSRCDSRPVTSSGCRAVRDAALGFSGWPPYAAWREIRILDAAALDLCAIAAGRLDGWVDCETDAHGPWDYLAGMLICQEAGVEVVDAFGRDLISRDPNARRTPVAGATQELCRELVAYRRSFTPAGVNGR